MSKQHGLTGATAMPHKTRQPGTWQLQKRKARTVLPVRALKSQEVLLPYDQLLDLNFAIDFQPVEVDA
jgi:hypothetical protein